MHANDVFREKAIQRIAICGANLGTESRRVAATTVVKIVTESCASQVAGLSTFLDTRMASVMWAALSVVVLATAAFRAEGQQISIGTNVTDVGLKLFATFPGTDETNVVFSPLGIYALLALLHVGSAGPTSAEIGLVSGITNGRAGRTAMISPTKQLLSQLQRKGAGTAFVIANALFVKKGVKITRKYKRQLKAPILNAIARTVDAISIREINQWAKEATRGMIPEFLDDELPRNTVLALLNAVYFKGVWQSKFSPASTRLATFYNSDRTRSKHPMMTLKARLPFAVDQDLNADLVALPYTGDAFMFLLLVPRKRFGVKRVKKYLDVATFNRLLQKLRDENFEIKLPRFEIDASQDLQSSLRKLGVKTAFDTRADFKPLTTAAEIYVSSMSHKSRIVVNETGSEAAAVSSAIVTKMGIKGSVIADHPFLFFIVAKKQKVVLFMGQVNKLG